MVIRTFIILVLAGVIFGGAAYFVYELYWRPRQLDREDKQQAAALPAPTPDEGLPAFAAAAALQREGRIAEAQSAWHAFLDQYPESSQRAKARAALGEINLGAIFSPGAPGAIFYTVAGGDSLARIAAKHRSSAELLYRVNNLESLLLRIGQQIAIPQLDPKLVVTRSAGTVTLYNREEFVKEYAAASLKTPGLAAAPVETKVVDKFALQDDKRVAFGEKNYAGSDRWIMLGASGLVIRGAPASSGGPPPAGILLAPADLDELFLLVSRGTPVRIE